MPYKEQLSKNKLWNKLTGIASDVLLEEMNLWLTISHVLQHGRSATW